MESAYHGDQKSNRHSATVDRALVLRISVSGPKFTAVHVYLYTDCRTRWVGRGYLFTLRSEPPARPHLRIGTSTRSVQGRIRTFPVRRPNSSPGAWSRAADAIAYEYPFAQTGMTFRSVIRIAYKTPIWNRHSDVPVAPLSPQDVDISLPGDRNRPQGPISESALRPGRHKVAFGHFRSGGQIPLRECGRGLPMQSHTDTGPFAQTGITFRSAIRRRFGVEKPSFRALKLRF
ncbi:hypothetical protein Taro_048145 [Colocasia esculenta]|uniref:Uncharacterized protein n=1 Tax=Colocasia esculenta TaxID=4460 RepID=A0A843X669_COLES|nr:hypothetical protein [Colocasia esculenta]